MFLLSSTIIQLNSQLATQAASTAITKRNLDGMHFGKLNPAFTCNNGDIGGGGANAVGEFFRPGLQCYGFDTKNGKFFDLRERETIPTAPPDVLLNASLIEPRSRTLNFAGRYDRRNPESPYDLAQPRRLYLGDRSDNQKEQLVFFPAGRLFTEGGLEVGILELTNIEGVRTDSNGSEKAAAAESSPGDGFIPASATYRIRFNSTPTGRYYNLYYGNQVSNIHFKTLPGEDTGFNNTENTSTIIGLMNRFSFYIPRGFDIATPVQLLSGERPDYTVYAKPTPRKPIPKGAPKKVNPTILFNESQLKSLNPRINYVLTIASGTSQERTLIIPKGTTFQFQTKIMTFADEVPSASSFTFTDSHGTERTIPLDKTASIRPENANMVNATEISTIANGANQYGDFHERHIPSDDGINHYVTNGSPSLKELESADEFGSPRKRRVFNRAPFDPDLDYTTPLGVVREAKVLSSSYENLERPTRRVLMNRPSVSNRDLFYSKENNIRLAPKPAEAGALLTNSVFQRVIERSVTPIIYRNGPIEYRICNISKAEAQSELRNSQNHDSIALTGIFDILRSGPSNGKSSLELCISHICHKFQSPSPNLTQDRTPPSMFMLARLLRDAHDSESGISLEVCNDALVFTCEQNQLIFDQNGIPSVANAPISTILGMNSYKPYMPPEIERLLKKPHAPKAEPEPKSEPVVVAEETEVREEPPTERLMSDVLKMDGYRPNFPENMRDFFGEEFFPTPPEEKKATSSTKWLEPISSKGLGVISFIANLFGITWATTDFTPSEDLEVQVEPETPDYSPSLEEIIDSSTGLTTDITDDSVVTPMDEFINRRKEEIEALKGSDKQLERLMSVSPYIFKEALVGVFNGDNLQLKAMMAQNNFGRLQAATEREIKPLRARVNQQLELRKGTESKSSIESLRKQIVSAKRNRALYMGRVAWSERELRGRVVQLFQSWMGNTNALLLGAKYDYPNIHDDDDKEVLSNYFGLRDRFIREASEKDGFNNPELGRILNRMENLEARVFKVLGVSDKKVFTAQTRGFVQALRQHLHVRHLDSEIRRAESNFHNATTSFDRGFTSKEEERLRELEEELSVYRQSAGVSNRALVILRESKITTTSDLEEALRRASEELTSAQKAFDSTQDEATKSALSRAKIKAEKLTSIAGMEIPPCRENDLINSVHNITNPFEKADVLEGIAAATPRGEEGTIARYLYERVRRETSELATAIRTTAHNHRRYQKFINSGTL